MAVILLRGISGAGKSTFTKHHYPDAVVVSADHYFMEDNLYIFNPDKLPEAHADCLRKFIDLCRGGESLIIVDNTNTSPTECAPYMAVAAAYGHTAQIITIDCDPGVAHHRNVHNVPLKTIQAQHDRLTRSAKAFPPYWKHMVIPAVIPPGVSNLPVESIPPSGDGTVAGEWG